MTTYLTHPEHGTHLAYDDGEVERCKKNGWVVYGDKPPPAEGVVPAKDFHDSRPVVGIDYDGDGVIDQVFKKRGRPKKS